MDLTKETTSMPADTFEDGGGFPPLPPPPQLPPLSAGLGTVDEGDSLDGPEYEEEEVAIPLTAPPTNHLTITFKGHRKNLDLAVPTAEGAQHWVRELAKLHVHLDAMSQRERLDHWIHSYLHQADLDHDSKMSSKEIKSLLRMVNVDMNDMYAYRLFKECDRSNNEQLEGTEIEEFLWHLLKSPELEDIFHRYSGEDCGLSASELLEFLEDQGEDGATLTHTQQLIQTYKLNETAKQHELMTLDGFMMYLLSLKGLPWTRPTRPLPRDAAVWSMTAGRDWEESPSSTMATPSPPRSSSEMWSRLYVTTPSR
ncbi:hypothetical protein MC885_017201 [Smutsia gigantea]|nr:hypothetical protein MC885_017201 [Smutsia gigantea]